MTRSRPLSAAGFWAWFLRERGRLAGLDGAEAADRIHGQATRYADGLFVEVGDEEDGARDLVVSASGRADLVPDAEALAAAAPRVPGWRVVSLKPALGFDFTHERDGHVFDARRLWFTPLARAGHPAHLGIRVHVPGLAEVGEDRARRAVATILQTGLGERVYLTELSRVEIAACPDDAEASGLLRLVDLPRYVAWHRGRHPS